MATTLSKADSLKAERDARRILAAIRVSPGRSMSAAMLAEALDISQRAALRALSTLRTEGKARMFQGMWSLTNEV